MLWLVLLPTGAHATTYCVQDPACVGTPKTFLQDALDAAQTAPGADQIEIGSTSPGYIPGGSYSSSDALTIVGAGNGTTLAGGSTVLSLEGGAVTVSDLRVVLQPGSNQAGLRLVEAHAERVDVTDDASAADTTAVVLDGGTFTDGTIALNGTGKETGIRSQGSTSTVQRATVAARFGIVTNLGTTNVDDTLIDLRGAPPNADGSGLIVDNDGNAQQTLTMNARHVTIVGNGGAGQTGASAVADIANQTAVLNLRSSIVRGVGHSLRRTATDGAAAVLTSYSNYDPGGIIDSNAGSGAGAITEQSKTNLDPMFVDPANGDFRLSVGSGLIDAGDPSALAIGESTKDRLGELRIADGNSDCDARRDVGAFEFVPAGLVAAVAVSPPAAHTGQLVTFDGSGSCDPEPGASLTFSWSFDDGGTANGAVVQHAFSTPASHSATLSVTSSTGRSGATTRTIPVTIPPAPAGTRSTSPPPPGPFTRKRPRSLVLIPARAVTISERGVAAMALRCRGVRRCTGELSLTTARPVETSGRKRVVKLGSTRFSIQGNRTTRVNVRLSKARLALVTRLKRLPVTATVTDRDGSGRKRKATRAIVIKAPLEAQRH